MPQRAKLFLNGRSQAVRLPADLRFDGTEVFIRKEPGTGDVILSLRPHLSWRSFFALRDEARDQNAVPDDFMSERGDTPAQDRDLF
jgi:antitoxin VapB